MPSGSAAATARTRSSSGQERGSSSSSSSLTRSAPPRPSAPATSATSAGVRPSAGLTIAPTRTRSDTSPRGPGSQAGHSTSTSRQRLTSARSAHSPATQDETSDVTPSGSSRAGKSIVTRAPSVATTRARTASGPAARLVDSSTASVSAHSGGSSSYVARIGGQPSEDDLRADLREDGAASFPGGTRRSSPRPRGDPHARRPDPALAARKARPESLPRALAAAAPARAEPSRRRRRHLRPGYRGSRQGVPAERRRRGRRDRRPEHMAEARHPGQAG